MPDIAANAFPVIFADFRRGYIIGDRLGMTMLRDPYSKKREGKVEFTFTKRFAGGVVLAEAFKKLKVST
jgi:HK97 family phage major capsid protein